MTHGKCRVDCLFPNHAIRWRVWTGLPLQYGHLTAYLTPFFRLNPQTPKRCHMDLWLARLVLTHLHLHQHRQHNLLQQQILKLCCFFFGGLPFALLVLQCRAAFSSLSFCKYVVRVALLFGPLPPRPRLAASAVAHLSGSWTVPWPLVWDSWPPLSFALSNQPSLPDHLENNLIWVDSTKVIPLASCRMSLERLIGTCESWLLLWHYCSG